MNVARYQQWDTIELESASNFLKKTKSFLLLVIDSGFLVWLTTLALAVRMKFLPQVSFIDKNIDNKLITN